MKKLIHLLGFLCMCILLTGCISIPVGDSQLEVTKDGVEFVPNEEGDELEDDGSEEADPEDVVDPEPETVVNGEQEESKPVDDQASKSCDEDYSELTERLKPGFFIPDCTVITSLSMNSKEIVANLLVEGDWKDLSNAYKEYFANNLHSENQNRENKSVELIAYLYEDAENYTSIKVQQKAENVEVRIIQKTPEVE